MNILGYEVNLSIKKNKVPNAEDIFVDVLFESQNSSKEISYITTPKEAEKVKILLQQDYEECIKKNKCKSQNWYDYNLQQVGYNKVLLTVSILDKE